MLGIRKERIDPGQPWQDYAETLFSIQRRLADHAFSNARTWPEIQQAHQTWWKNYNSEHHYAHRERQDGRHSPSEVLRGVLGRTYPEEVLSPVLKFDIAWFIEIACELRRTQHARKDVVRVGAPQDS